MTLIEALLAVTRAYATATGLAEATISRRFLGGGSRAATLCAGGDMGALTIAKAIERFARNWPPGAAWPEGVERPAAPALAEPRPEMTQQLDESRAQQARCRDVAGAGKESAP
jgi:hypothetical protein